MKVDFKRTICLICWLCLIITPMGAAWAISINEVPNPRQINGTWVSDVANILSDRTEDQLNRRISQLEARNGSEIAVVTISEISPSQTSKAYATQLFNTWGIGKRGVDNGVLFLVVVKQRRIEIETGRGITPHISNAEVAQIIDAKIKPEFKLQQFDQGMINGVEAMAKQLESINFTKNFANGSLDNLFGERNSPEKRSPVNQALSSSSQPKLVALSNLNDLLSMTGLTGFISVVTGYGGTLVLLESEVKRLNTRKKKPFNSSPLLALSRYQNSSSKLLKYINKIAILLNVAGIGLISTYVNMSELYPKITTSNDLLLFDAAVVSIIFSLVQLPLYVGTIYYWLQESAKNCYSLKLSSLWAFFNQSLIQNFGWWLGGNFLLLGIAIVLALPVTQTVVAGHWIFFTFSLVVSLFYQLFWIRCVNMIPIHKVKTELSFSISRGNSSYRDNYYDSGSGSDSSGGGSSGDFGGGGSDGGGSGSDW